MESILGPIRFSEPKNLIRPQPKDLKGYGFNANLNIMYILLIRTFWSQVDFSVD